MQKQKICKKRKPLFGDSDFLKNLHKEYWRTQYGYVIGTDFNICT